jgi:hypothetical protein
MAVARVRGRGRRAAGGEGGGGGGWKREREGIGPFGYFFIIFHGYRPPLYL